jgi:hypothetical protein
MSWGIFFVNAPMPGLSQDSEVTTRPTGRTLRRAWICVACIPVAFVLAMVAGEGLIDALGYPSGGPDPPLWAALLVGIPMTLVGMTPAVLAFIYGRQAGRERSSRSARAATIVGAVVATYWVVTFVLGLLQRAVG